MLSKKNWIKKLDEDTLKLLFSKQNVLKVVPEKLKIKLSYMAENYNKLHSKDKIKTRPLKLFLRYSFALSILIIIAIGSFYLYQNFYLSKYRNICQVTEVKGNAYKLFFNKPVMLKLGDTLKEKSIVNIDKDSSLNLKIGENIHATVGEKSHLKLTKLHKRKKTENTGLFLESGEAKFNISKLTQNSTFNVQTVVLSANVVGTNFTVKETIDHNTIIQVHEGKVHIRLNMDIPLKKLKKVDLNLYNQVKTILEQINILLINQEIQVSLSKVKQLEKEINILVENLEKSVKDNKNNSEKINTLIEDAKITVNEWHKIYNEILEPKTIEGQELNKDNEKPEEKTKNITIKKLSSNPGIILKEKDTSITGDSRYIYITSDSQKAIFSVDSISGKLKWKFTHPLLTKITSSSVIYQNNIILCTSKNIFIINKNGQINTVLDINEGPVYWAEPVFYKKTLLIPANDMIYQFNETNLTQYEKIFDNPGQLYFSNIRDNLTCIYNINSRTIQIYDLNKHKSLEISTSLKQRAFMPPVANGKYIFIADNVNTIYRFDSKLQNKQPKKLKLSTGVVSQILINSNILYFIGNDGAFYKVNAQSFKEENRIYQVDKNPDSNKYLVKKPVLYENSIFFCSDTGKVFYYDIENNKADFINIADYTINQPLIIHPVKINNALYFVDTSSNIYKLIIE